MQLGRPPRRARAPLQRLPALRCRRFGDAQNHGASCAKVARVGASATDYPQPLEVEGFLSEAESTHLMRLAEPLLEPSRVNAAGHVTASTNTITRRSETALLPHAALTEDLVLKKIGERVAELTGTSVIQQEPLQVVRYQPGDYFNPHFDAGRDFSTLWLGMRKVTVLLYLNQDFEGGATTFPELGVDVTPQSGKALLFYNLSPIEGSARAEPHPLSLHAGAAVESGEKWAVNVWIRERSYLPSTGLKLAVVAGYTMFWAATIITIAVVVKPAWLLPS